MSIVIVGGHDRMAGKYKEIGKNYRCKTKVFTKTTGGFKEQIGCPDLMIVFTNTVSHRMVLSAVKHAQKNGVPIMRCHTSSGEALKTILSEYC